jgi:tetratricopeptide (TPR) repeat protein
VTDIQEQIEQLKSFAAADPDNALIWISLGDLYYRAGQLGEAQRAFERAAKAEPGNTVAQGRLARLKIAAHDFAGAEALLRELIAAGENDPAFRYNLGIALLHLHRYEEALGEINDIAGNVDAADLDLYRAQAHHQLGDNEASVRFARSWAKSNPGPGAEGYLSLLEFDAGQTDQARPRAQAVLEAEPENPDASVVIGTWRMEQQDIDEAEELFSNVTRLEPENMRGWLGSGLAALYRRDFPKAIELLERAQGCQPDNVGAVTTLGWAHLLHDDTECAEAVFREAIDIDRNFGEAHGGLAIVLTTLGRDGEAQDEIRRARGLDPVGFGYRIAESLMLRSSGEEEAANRKMRALLEESVVPGGPSLLESLQIALRMDSALPFRQRDDDLR